MILIQIHDYLASTTWFGSVLVRFGHYKTVFAFYNVCDTQNAVPITQNRSLFGRFNAFHLLSVLSSFFFLILSVFVFRAFMI